jgi:hypothetical protein
VRGAGDDGPSLVEAFAVWALFALAAAVVAVTYARLPTADLYNVSESGLAGGFGRALVFLNFPTTLVALALVAFPVDRLRSRAADAAALVAVALCLVVAVPGVVEEDDLDAKAANAIPALGVAIALGLTLVAFARTGSPPRERRVAGDRVRVVLAAVLIGASLPWIAAELGFYVDDLPGVEPIFLADEVVPEPDHPELRAVHVGHHHGTDGVLLALAALALSRSAMRVRRPRLRTALTAYLALMLVYGLANALQDFWLEQLVKRGTTSFRFPDMLRPDLGPEWLGILLASAAVYALLVRSSRPRPQP